MKQLRLIVFVLLAVSVTGIWAQDKSPTVLLQEGLYCEETEGDLEKAIGIYQQVLEQAGETQRIAAKAMYRLGMCHLKKGEKEKAAAYFQQVVSDYPTQKIVAKQASDQLKKITQAIASAKYAFGPVIEKIINDAGVGKDFMFDLDTGKFLSVLDVKNWSDASEASKQKGLEEFMMEGVVDLFGETSRKSIIGIDIIAMPTHDERWSMSPEDVIEQVSMGKPGTPVALSADGELPKTFVFKTEQGGMGILQIIEMRAEKKPRHFKIRYKMLQKEKAKSPIDLSTPETTIKSFIKAVYAGNLEAARACVSKDGADYDEFMEMLTTESNHPFQAMIKAMDVSVPVEITSRTVKDGKCKLSWYFALGRVYYFGEAKMKKGTLQKFSSYLELVGDKWLIRDI